MHLQGVWISFLYSPYHTQLIHTHFSLCYLSDTTAFKTMCQSLVLGSKNSLTSTREGNNYFPRPAGYSLLRKCGMRLTLFASTANSCSLCPPVPQVPFYKAALQSVHLQHAQDFLSVFAEVGETPGNAFLQLVLVPLSQQPCPLAYQFLP